jgi:hypothetical protein
VQRTWHFIKASRLYFAPSFEISPLAIEDRLFAQKPLVKLSPEGANEEKRALKQVI